MKFCQLVENNSIHFKNKQIVNKKLTQICHLWWFVTFMQILYRTTYALFSAIIIWNVFLWFCDYVWSPCESALVSPKTVSEGKPSSISNQICTTTNTSCREARSIPIGANKLFPLHFQGEEDEILNRPQTGRAQWENNRKTNHHQTNSPLSNIIVSLPPPPPPHAWILKVVIHIWKHVVAVLNININRPKLFATWKDRLWWKLLN